MTSYDHIAEHWHAGPRRFGVKKYVEMILAPLNAGSRILDLGCGTGAPVAEYLLERGFRVVCVDESARMLEIARRVVPGAELIRADMCEVSLEGPFAAAIAWDSIFHVERSHHASIFRKLHDALEPGGLLLLSTGGDGDEGFTSEMYGHEFFYSGYGPEQTMQLLREAGFEIKLSEVDDPSSRGHVAIIARRND